MLLFNFGCGHDLCAERQRVEKPLSAFILGNSLEPFVVVQAGVAAEHFVEPLVLSQNLVELTVGKSLLLISVHVLALSTSFSKCENVNSDELAELLKDRLEVFVTGRDLLVSLEATLLQDCIECFGLVLGFLGLSDSAVEH